MLRESKKNISLCFFNTSKDWGGGEKWHFEMALWLKNKGYKVCICAFPESELFNIARTHSIPVYGFKISNLSFLNPFVIKKLKAFFLKIKITHIILNLPSDLKTGGRAARKASLEKIIYRRGSAKPIRNSFSNRYLFRNIIDLVIANSQRTKETILENNPDLFPKENILVIYNGIDESKYENSVKEPQPDKLIIGTAGRLSREKGHMRLIEVAKLLKEKKLTFKLEIAGRGPEEEKLKEATQNLDLEDYIHFAGFVEPFTDFLKGIDVFVLPSYYEGFGYVLIEAMAAEKPVLSFEIGATDEIISHGENGYLIPDNDIEIMAGKIKALADNPELIGKFGKKGKQIVQDHFSFDTMAERFLACIIHKK